MKIVSSIEIVELDYSFTTYEEVVFNKMKVKVKNRSRLFYDESIFCLSEEDFKPKWMYFYDIEEVK